MRETMEAFRLRAWGEAPEFEEVPVPVPRPGEVLVEVAAVGLCHTDVHFLEAKPGDYAYPVPFTLGHEIAGRVVDDAYARAAGFEAGQAVVVALGPRCGRCRRCVAGEDNLCERRSFGRGWGLDGGLARYLAVAPRDLVSLRTLDPVLAAPLTDAAVTAHHAVRRVLPRLRGGDSTAIVIGVGGLGGFAVQLLRQQSTARVVAIDTRPESLTRATAFGADVACAAADVSADVLRDLTAGRGADAVLDFVGVDATMRLALGAVRAGGSVGIVGAGGGTATIGWGHVPNDCEVLIPIGGTTADLHDVVALAEAGRLIVDVETFPFADTAAAYERAASGAVLGRAVVTLG